VLTGKTPGSLNAIVGRSANVPSPSVRLQRGVPAKVVEGRPDVQAAMARYAQSVAKVGQAEANLYPTASLIGSLSTSASKPGDLAKASSISWSYGPSVTVPIFSGGSLTAARDIAGAQRDEQLIAWKASVLAALEDVENASVGLSQSRVKVSDLSRATAAYRRSDALSLTLYKAGSASFLDFLDAERSLYSSEDSMIQARVAVALQHVALAKALGGGIGARIDISKPEVVDHDVGPRPRGI
jgi:outer membrane protein TolC